MKEKIISKGKILSFDPIKRIGFIKSETGEELNFNSTSLVSNTINIGSTVSFIRIPSKVIDGAFEAVNITRAYLSRDNYYVVDRQYSHLHDDIEENLARIVDSISCNGRSFFVEQIDYDHPVGLSSCIKVCEEDEIIYAIRKGRKGYTKFVKNRAPEPTNSITIILKKTNDFYTIITAFFGEKPEVEPWDKRANEASFEYWNTHALIYDSTEIDLYSVRKDCPWNITNKKP